MPTPDLDLDLLRAFVAVTEAGGFTAAADVVGRSQSALSQKILRLEKVLDYRVFDRTSRSLSLTREGEQLLRSGRRMLAEYDSFMRGLRAPPVTTTLRLGISENLIQTQLPQLLSKFSELYPDVLLELTTDSSKNLLAEHSRGNLDVVIARTKSDGTARNGRVIWREPLVWIAASDYQVDALRPARLVMMRAPCAYREVMTDALDSLNREWVSACTASNLSGLQAAVAGGLGVTALGKSFVRTGMKVVPTSDQWPALPDTEVSLLGDDPSTLHIVQPLVALLTESLAQRELLPAPWIPA
jgi:DNA-binding transcriptional LysR family regulator